MYEYYFKIRKGDIEFECSTTDKTTFEQQLSDWINGIVQGKPLVAPADEKNISQTEEQDNFSDNNEEKPQRSGFIDVKNLSSINEIQTPDFDFQESKEHVSNENISFEEALNESIENPKTEVVEKVDTISEFEDFAKEYNPQTPVDYLIVAGLYILNIENQERFTIKQINSKVVPLSGKPVDHAVMQEAIEQGYVRIVPDLTETSEFTEYTLTEQGEGYFVV